MLIGLLGRHCRLDEADHAAEDGCEGRWSGGIVAVAGDAPVIHRVLHDHSLLVAVGVGMIDDAVVALVLLMGRVYQKDCHRRGTQDCLPMPGGIVHRLFIDKSPIPPISGPISLAILPF